MKKQEETIVALATPAGVGAISVIRLSGPDSFAVTDKIFSGRKKIAACKSHTLHYGKITDSEGITVDDVVVSVYRSPHSYTGEDSAEISCHGSPLIVQKIISLLLEAGARQAEPGEFTKRAYLNGRMDLSQAEAVVSVIQSSGEASLRGARNQIDGFISSKVNDLRERLLNLSSLVELELDFAEEDLEFVPEDILTGKIDNVVKELDILISSFRYGKVLRDGVNVALVGMPNVGKSSLLNFFLKEYRAIVSEIPGTTRDIIREDVVIDGIMYRLFDTAGIRKTSDVIESEGVIRSRETISSADLVLFISDVVQQFNSTLYQEVTSLTDPLNVIRVMNKTDLAGGETLPDADIYISVKNGTGIDHLFDYMRNKVSGQTTYTEKTAIITSARHLDCLKRARQHLITAKDTVRAGLTGEFISVDIRNSEAALAEIVGAISTDDILNNIFLNFCIGK
ncbi:MAG: tRNA uridine-5-carboxymethylaminomethyl(34) synthesis GTPase MnmE [Ignavibacteriaceae bacterium]|nr:tRNA uridine-5-carboxymethylaminomethyl(34) synthesis GTPase MnmE [Ignavibacteriaceae bacterium]